MKRALIKSWKTHQSLVERPIYALEDQLPTAKGLIQHFGFQYHSDGVWVY